MSGLASGREVKEGADFLCIANERSLAFVRQVAYERSREKFGNYFCRAPPRASSFRPPSQACFKRCSSGFNNPAMGEAAAAEL